MTLIEVMLEYQRLWVECGRERAARWLHNVCDESLWEHIEHSFDAHGMFVDADGWPITVISRSEKPQDYEQCGYCGFDHAYEAIEARAWHRANPRQGYDEKGDPI